MGFFLVMKAEVVRGLIIMRRYWFATLTGIIIGYGFLLGIAYGFMRGSLSLDEFAASATSGALGLIIGMFAFGIVGMFTSGIQGMARTGELEQVYLSPHGLVANFMARSLVSSILSVLSWSIMLILVSKTVKSTLFAPPIPMATLLALTYFNLLGFGFMVGGLVLVFKQTGQVAILIRLLFLGIPVLVSDSIYDWDTQNNPVLLLVRGILHAVPIADASICLKLVLIKGEGMGIFTHPSFFFCILNGVAWTFIGILCFRYCETWSRARGTLGAY